MSAGRHSRRTWGWYPLVDEWARRVVERAGVSTGELVLDIGAGEGAITRHLLAAGCRVVAVELHPGRASHLVQRCGCARLTVRQCDFGTMRLPAVPFRVVANPPYAGSALLLRRLLAPRSRLTGADIVLQRAVVRRYADGLAPGAGRWGRQYDVRVGMSLPRRAFRPPPRVDSAVLVVRRRGIDPTGGPKAVMRHTPAAADEREHGENVHDR